MSSESNKEALDNALSDLCNSLVVPGTSADNILTLLRAADFEITWARKMDEKGMRWALLLKPRSKQLVDGFNLLREVLVLISAYDEFQPRELASIEEIQAMVGGRFDDELFLVVSSDPRLQERLRPLERGSTVLIPLTPAWIEKRLASGNPSPGFRSLLKTRLYARDLFDKTGPVKGRDFFGRELLLQDIEDQIRRRTHLGLFGLRKVGKTSILSALEARQRARLPDALIVRSDLLAFLPGQRTRHHLLEEIWRMIVRGDSRLRTKTTNDYIAIPEIHDWPVNKLESALDRNLKSYLRYLGAQGKTLVLMLDEIERLFPTPGVRQGFQGYLELLEFLRGLAQTLHSLVIIVVGVNPHISEAQYIGSRDNPMFNFFTPRYVEPLDAPDASEMMRELGRAMGARFDHKALKEVFDLTGGHPFLTRKYCSHLLSKTKRPCRVTAEQAQSARDSFMRAETDSFAEMVSVVKDHFPEEYDALLRISHGEAATESYLPNVIAHLEGYQLITAIENVCKLRMEAIGVWLRSSPPTTWGKSAAAASAAAMRRHLDQPDGPITANEIDQQELGNLLGALEGELRGFIRRVLLTRWGESMNKRIELAIGEEAMLAARSRQDDRVVKYSTGSTDVDVLDFLYLGDLKRILVGNEWQEFRVVFKDKKKVEDTLNVLSSAHIELRHGRPLVAVEAMRAFVAANDIAATFKGA